MYSTPSLFAATGHSQFLENILDPASEAVSIPDDVLARHVIKSDTVSGTYTPEGQMMFVTNLSRPDTYLGVVYSQPTPTTYTAVEEVLTSQTYGKDFTDVRHISADLTLVNNTVSTTNFTVSGTVNAITYQGKLHELCTYDINGIATLPTYSQLAGITASAMDKAVSVALSGGIKVLALPDSFDVPYYRINNTAQPQEINGLILESVASASDYDDLYSMRYSSSTTTGNQALFMQPLTAYNTPITVNVSSRAPTAGTTYEVKYHTLSGTAITGGTYVSPGTGAISFVDVLEPKTGDYVVAVTLSIANGTLTLGETGTFSVRVSNGNLPGFLMPTNVLMTNGLPAGANLVWSGCKNTELKPNAALARNVPTKYPYFDPNEMNYVRMVLANRDKLRIRTVLPMLVYEEAIRVWKDYTFVNRSENIKAEALDLWPIINTIRKVAVPALSAIFPAAAPVINAIDQGVSAIMPMGDSLENPAARPQQQPCVASAMDRPMYRSYAADNMAFDFLEDLVQPEDHEQYNNMLNVLDNWHHYDEPGPSQAVLVGKQHNIKRAVLFPVILSTGTSGPRGTMLYAAVSGYHPELLRKHAAVTGSSLNGRRVLGYEGNYPYTLENDVTLVPISAYRSDTLMVLPSAPVVTGTSCLAAIHLASKGKHMGVYRHPVTGSVHLFASHVVPMPNMFYTYKNRYVQRYTGAPLVQAEVLTRGGNTTPANAMSKLDDKAFGKAENNWPATTPPSIHPDHTIFKSYAASYYPGAYQQMSSTNPLMDDMAPSMPASPMPQGMVVQIPPVRGVPSTDAYNMGLYMATLYPQLKHLPEVLEWMVQNDIVDSVHKIAQSDPSGQLTRTRWAAIANGAALKGPSTTENQRSRLERLLADLSKQYRGITMDWLVSNDSKGPTAAQAKYYSATGLLPPAGAEPPMVTEAAMPAGVQTPYGPPPEGKELLTLSKNYQAKIQSRVDNDASLSVEARDALGLFGATYKRAPSTSEYVALKAAHQGSVDPKSDRKASGRGNRMGAQTKRAGPAAGWDPSDDAYNKGTTAAAYFYTQPPNTLV